MRRAPETRKIDQADTRPSLKPARLKVALGLTLIFWGILVAHAARAGLPSPDHPEASNKLSPTQTCREAIENYGKPHAPGIRNCQNFISQVLFQGGALVAALPEDGLKESDPSETRSEPSPAVARVLVQENLIVLQRILASGEVTQGVIAGSNVRIKDPIALKIVAISSKNRADLHVLILNRTQTEAESPSVEYQILDYSLELFGNLSPKAKYELGPIEALNQCLRPSITTHFSSSDGANLATFDPSSGRLSAVCSPNE